MPGDDIRQQVARVLLANDLEVGQRQEERLADAKCGQALGGVGIPHNLIFHVFFTCRCATSWQSALQKDGRGLRPCEAWLRHDDGPWPLGASGQRFNEVAPNGRCGWPAANQR